MTDVHIHFYVHGLVILLVGLLAGVPFATAIKTGNGREVAWRVVHAGASSGGALVIAIGSMIGHLGMSGQWNAIALVTQIVASYGLVGGMVLAAATGERGIGQRAAGPPTAMWWTVKLLYHTGVVTQLASVGILLVAALRRLAGG
jgi:hypothetical protein